MLERGTCRFRGGPRARLQGMRPGVTMVAMIRQKWLLMSAGQLGVAPVVLHSKARSGVRGSDAISCLSGRAVADHREAAHAMTELAWLIIAPHG